MSVRVDMRELEAFAAKLEQLTRQEEIDRFCESCAKELAARLLRKVIKRTPVGVYGDEYISKKGKKKYRRFKTVKFTTKQGEEVQFKAKRIRTGGTLRRGWISVTHEQAVSGQTIKPEDFVKRIAVKKVGNNYEITVFNPVEYAKYVEYGHRTRNHKGWVDGHFMLTVSEAEVNRQKEGVLKRKLNEFLRECFDD